MKRTAKDSAVLFVLALGTTALIACPASLDDRCAEGACDPSVSEAGVDGQSPDANVPDAPVPPNCDENADAISEEAKGCLDDTFALFVDGTSGDDTNPGTKSSPMKSIAAAVAKGPTLGKRRVYVCGNGPYVESVEITSPVHLFGGFACGTWTADSSLKPHVTPDTPGYALHVNGVAADLRVEDIAFEALAGTVDAPSSIAVFVANSPSVTFKRVDIKANGGFTSPDGNAGVMGTPDQDPRGNDGTPTAGGAEKECKCSTGGVTRGGKGGDPTGTESGGKNGEPVITPPNPPVATGQGGTRDECEGGTGNGRRGSDAPPAPAAPRAPLGTLDASGWKPGDGAKGSNGTPGQGGGGGGSYRIGAAGQNGGGGGGGCGGCGGSGGDGGKGGGASVALLSFDSLVRLSASTLTASDAGNGAAGKDGGPGGSGGLGGGGGNGGCPGGIGGDGGKGGAGAGGAGGVSAAVFYKGAAPIAEGSTLNHGAKGAGGKGGKSPDNDGPDGLEGAIVEAL